jgi:hypothetical protein
MEVAIIIADKATKKSAAMPAKPLVSNTTATSTAG